MMFLLSIATHIASVTAGWSHLCMGQNSSCPTFMFGLACKDKDLCAVSGGFSNTPAGVYYSKDQFQTTTLATMDAESPFLLDLAIDSQGNGAAAGVGVLGTGILISKDVETWEKSGEVPFVAGQSIKSLGDGGEFGYVGDTGGNTGGVQNQGVLMTTNSGKSWTAENWPASVSNLTQARYGSFPSEQVLYVTGGNFPSAPPSPSATAIDKTCLQLSESSCLPADASLVQQHRQRSSLRGNTYFGLISKSADAGKTWEVQYQTNGFYFNDIDCIDVDTCIAVGEAHAGSSPGGYVMSTVNGGKNWTQVFKTTVPGAGMMAVQMTSKLEAWVGGGDTKGSAIYHTVDAGKTWKMSGIQYPLIGEIFKLHFVDSTLGFATAVTKLQSSTLLKYTA